ncbi:bestrophin-3 isoform X2 [Glossina fuscipes]|uniref:Bestrophin-3 isoform X2 n=1 Tax=Glossina fuscipes TaxID=7396 RepID=A0A9C5ZRE2_9MUSC|nr:bestrophin-3 isoform X2 [Glossina fuscipes]
MTVSYAGEVPNGSSFGCFWKILWKWRGSVYKLVWRELIAYLCLYYTINLVYRFALNEQQQKIFYKIRAYFGQQSESIPMSFVLGFYVNLVVKRWWEQYRLLPWPDTLALFISAAIPNSSGGVNNETGRLMRRNIMRYMVLAYVITLQRISLRVKRRFPTTQHLVDAGLMHESEMKIFESLNQKSPMSKYWMPLVWATNIINRARKDGLIASDHIVQTILMELSDIRRRLGGLIGYDTVCVPLVYTQVVTLVLYTYFIAALLGRQMCPELPNRDGKEDSDLYFPLFTVLQFVFYVGWLKVAEVLINPFGEDDDDIELNWLIDRHIKAAYMIVDEMHEEHPELLRDQYWECVVPKDLPYTVASEHYRKDEPKGSAENYKVKKEDAMYANIVPGGGKRIVTDDVYADYESVDTPMVERRKNNWLVRQLSRMGSMRSQSTAYSSGGMAFNRNRLNSVYSSPESGLPMTIIQQQQSQHQVQQQMQSKPSLYEKFVHRKSLRAQRQLIKQNTRLNGLNVNTSKTRPRIPTPDVSKETNDSNGHPNTNALAQAVMPSNLKDINFGVTASIPVTSNITTLSFPFTTNSTDTAATLNILPIATTQIPTITTTASGFDTNDVITTIPVSLSIQRTPSSISISELNNSNDKSDNNNLSAVATPAATAILSVKPLNGGTSISRNNSFNAKLNLNISNDSSPSYMLEREQSIRSEGRPDKQDIVDNSNNNISTSIITAAHKLTAKEMNSLNNANTISAPTTLAKRTADSKTGEVYV